LCCLESVSSPSLVLYAECRPTLLWRENCCIYTVGMTRSCLHPLTVYMVLVMIENRRIKIVNRVTYVLPEGFPFMFRPEHYRWKKRTSICQGRCDRSRSCTHCILRMLTIASLDWPLFSQNLQRDPCEFCLKHISSFICTYAK